MGSKSSKCAIELDVDILRKHLKKDIVSYNNVFGYKKIVEYKLEHQKKRIDPWGNSYYNCPVCCKGFNYVKDVLPMVGALSEDNKNNARVLYDYIFEDRGIIRFHILYSKQFVAKLRWKKLKNIIKVFTLYKRFVNRYYTPPNGKGYKNSMSNFTSLVKAN